MTISLKIQHQNKIHQSIAFILLVTGSPRA